MKYKDAVDAFDGLRSWEHLSQGSKVQTWYLTLQPESKGNEALYVHVEDPKTPIGVAVCKITRGSLLGCYAIGNKFKDQLGL